MRTIPPTFAFAVLLLASAATAAEPAISRRQIEQDWLRQEELRDHAFVPTTAARTNSGSVRPEEDAVGGCDGVKDGKWGFHTADELNPWWRVDLGQPTAIDHLLLFNRCDTMSARIARLMVLVSDDDKTWRQVFQNNGTVFYGYTDKKPLEVKLAGRHGPIRAAATAGQELFPFGRGGDLRRGRRAERGPGPAGHAEQRQHLVGGASARLSCRRQPRSSRSRRPRGRRSPCRRSSVPSRAGSGWPRICAAAA